MGKKQEQLLQQQINAMNALIAKMQEPSNNPAQQALTNEALTGAEWLKKGDYSQKPTGMFFDFKDPVQQNEQYKKFANVSQSGTFALSDGGGRGEAQSLQNKFLQDKFARDASQNYQDNVSNSASTIRSALGGVADAKNGLDSRVLTAMQGLTGTIANMPQKTPWWQTLLGSAGSIAGAVAGFNRPGGAGPPKTVFSGFQPSGGLNYG